MNIKTNLHFYVLKILEISTLRRCKVRRELSVHKLHNIFENQIRSPFCFKYAKFLCNLLNLYNFQAIIFFIIPQIKILNRYLKLARGYLRTFTKTLFTTGHDFFYKNVYLKPNRPNQREQLLPTDVYFIVLKTDCFAQKSFKSNDQKGDFFIKSDKEEL